MSDIIKARRKTLSSRGEKIYHEIDRRLSYEYPYTDMLYARSKYSVSELRLAKLNTDKLTSKMGTEVYKGETIDTRIKASGQGKKKVSAADIGTAYHRIMDFLDFALVVDSEGKTDKKYIEEKTEYLIENKAIGIDVFKEIDIT